MMRPSTLRTFTVAAIATILVIVIAGLAWATHSVVRLEQFEARKIADRRFDEARALALSRIESILGPIVGREAERPYEHFRRIYKPADAFRARDGQPLYNVMLQSPLQGLPKSDWILVHFQASEIEGWGSPQVSHDLRTVMSAVAIPVTDRSRQAAPENWLAALAERYTPSDLLNALENAIIMPGTRHAGAVQDPVPIFRARGGDEENAARPFEIGEPGTSRTAAEFARRVERLRRMLPMEACTSSMVARENLQIGPARPGDLQSENVCLRISPMRAVWLELAPNEPPELAFVRSVSHPESMFCTLQGVLIDWGRLREELVAEVRDLFPKDVYSEPRIEPLLDRSTENDFIPGRLTIPARLVIDPPKGLAAEAALSGGLKLGLSIAWGVTLMALGIVAYATMKYVTMAERRLRFVSAVTHELRTPLTTFQLYTDLLHDGSDPTRQRAYIETLRRESKRLARLVENVLTYSRMGRAAPALERQRTSEAAILERVRVETAEPCESFGKRLEIDNRTGSAGVVTDTELVVQILANLVDNACKYASDAPDHRIWISAETVGDDKVAFAVEDAGAGIAQRDRRDVFRPFRRGRFKNPDQTAGMGLGLALSRYWAECLGGGLAVTRGTRNPAAFCRFELTIPIGPAERPATARSAVATAGTT